MSGRIKKTINEYRWWIKNNGKFLIDSSVDSLFESLRDVENPKLIKLEMSISGLGTYYGYKGIVQILEGNEEGWKHLAASLDFIGWVIKIHLFNLKLRRRADAAILGLMVSRMACLASLGVRNWTPTCLELLSEISGRKGLVREALWEQKIFEPFVIEANRFLNTGEVDLNRLKSPYRDIFLNLSDQESLSGAIYQVAEYHVKNMVDRSTALDPEFRHAPFDLLFPEFELIKKIVAKSGNSMPEIKHDLISVVPLDIRKLDAQESHEYNDKIKEAFISVFGSLSMDVALKIKSN